jgi:hypothetical protein
MNTADELKEANSPAVATPARALRVAMAQEHAA